MSVFTSGLALASTVGAPMNFGQAVQSSLRQYAGFHGRARRSEFWWFALFLVIGDLIVVDIVMGLIDSFINTQIPGIVVALAVLVPGIAVGIRRLHDTGRAAWWLLIGLIPIIGAIVLLVFFCQDSTSGDNKYGVSPKQAPAESGRRVNPLSGVIGEAWTTYRARARHLVAIAFSISIASSAVVVLLVLMLGVLGVVLGAVIGITATFLLQAALIKAIDDVHDGRADMPLRRTLAAARPFVAPVAAVSILAAVGMAVGFVLLIVPGLVLLTIWCLIVPVIVLEGAGVRAAFVRSRALVRGHGWHVFGTIVVVGALTTVIDIVLGFTVSALPTAVRDLISDTVSGALLAPFTAAVLTLAYFRLRAANEPSTPAV